ncbi:MAG: 4Fe-4S binding protein [Deltaproteobacteria bacterium]|nr:4Fe-4S binding protein [Deltaproteobacteria bacterium]
MARRISLIVVAVALTSPWTAQAGTAPPERLDCSKLPCARVLPGAASFLPVAKQPFVVGKDKAGKTVGWVALSTDVVDIKGYSGKPLVTLVALTPQAKISGALIVHHSEPIMLVGIPANKLTDFVDFYAGKSIATQIAVGASPNPKAITVDVISGATVTVLAENRTILETARQVAEAVGVIKATSRARGAFVASKEVWSWQRMIDQDVFGRLRVTHSQMGLAGPELSFVDLYFTIADAPQVGKALLGEHEYAWMKKQLAADEHLLVVLGNGSNSFKGSGFVRGGIFDRVRVEQGLRTVMFTDRDYKNLTSTPARGAPSFKEGAVFIVRSGKLDVGRSFDLVFLGSHYDGRGGFSREFRAFRASLRLPSSVYRVEGGGEQSIVGAAWYNAKHKVAILSAILLIVALLFVRRRWLTAKMKRLQAIHTATMIVAFVILGVVLHAQPSVTQVLTLVGTTKGGWSWSLFLSEPQIFIFWIFIAIVTIVWGRGVFCGWTCPYGAFNELLFKLGRFLRLPAFELPERWHLLLRKLRYLILLGLVAVFLWSPELGEKFAEVEPFKSTFYVMPWTRPLLFLSWWLLLALLALVWYRPFCRYLCPLGAALAVPGSLRRSGPRRRVFCEHCKICTRGCEPRAIRSDGTIDPRECLSCMECEANYRDSQVCPPLVGLQQLADRRRAGVALTVDEKARESRLQHDVKRV